MDRQPGAAGARERLRTKCGHQLAECIRVEQHVGVHHHPHTRLGSGEPGTHGGDLGRCGQVDHVDGVPAGELPGPGHGAVSGPVGYHDHRELAGKPAWAAGGRGARQRVFARQRAATRSAQAVSRLSVSDSDEAGRACAGRAPWGRGGGIDVNEGALTLDNSTVSKNTATNAAGIDSNFATVTLTDSTVSGNVAGESATSCS